MAGGSAPSLDQVLQKLRNDETGATGATVWDEVRLCLRDEISKQQLLKLSEAVKKTSALPGVSAAKKRVSSNLTTMSCQLGGMSLLLKLTNKNTPCPKEV